MTSTAVHLCGCVHSDGGRGTGCSKISSVLSSTRPEPAGSLGGGGQLLTAATVTVASGQRLLPHVFQDASDVLFSLTTNVDHCTLVVGERLTERLN